MPAGSGGAGRQVSALVRSHRPHCPKALDLAARLQEAGFREVLFAVDETHSAVDTGIFPKASHTLDSLAALGLQLAGPPSRQLWYCGDYAFYASALGRSDCDFWLMVEYDVGSRDRTSEWWRRLRLSLQDSRFAKLDMVGAYLGRYRQTHFRHGYADPWKAFFAITGLSARAVETLYKARLREASEGAVDPRGTHCEVFVPSELQKAGGFVCADLNDVLPGTAIRPAFSNMMICPLGHEDLIEGESGLIHRVIDMDEYIEKAPRVWAQAGRLDELHRHLTVLQERGLLAEQAQLIASRATEEMLHRSIRQRPIYAGSTRNGQP